MHSAAGHVSSVQLKGFRNGKRVAGFCSSCLGGWLKRPGDRIPRQTVGPVG